MGMEYPYEVVSSEDMLARVYECNRKLLERKKETGQVNKKEADEKVDSENENEAKENNESPVEGETGNP